MVEMPSTFQLASRELAGLMRPPNKPLERTGVNPCADVGAAAAGRSAPSR
jgi:hypothetical protein